MTRVATIVRCADLVRHLYATLRSVDRQTLAGGEIVLVTDDSTPGAVMPWVKAVAGRRGARVTHSPRVHPGAVRNAGIAAATAPVVICINAGDTVAVRCHEIAAARFAEQPEVGLLSSPVLVVGVAEKTRRIDSGPADLASVVGNPDAVHSASAFRRETWASLGKFDESLPALEDYDFWLRILSSGLGCAWIDEALLVRELRKDSLWYRDRDEDSYVAAMTAICQKHDGLFRRHSADALHARELALTGLGHRYRELIARRDDEATELERLTARAADLRRSLAPDGDGIDQDFRRISPLDRDWGYRRGSPVDRHYIEAFLEANAGDVAGAVLEVNESVYTMRFGRERVTRSDVVDIDAANPRATLVSDLREAANIPDNQYDCIIVTQTLHLIDDMWGVLQECHRILKPGGALLTTFPCASRLCLEYGPQSDFWRVTEAGARVLFEKLFAVDAFETFRYGNVFSSSAFLYGLATEELSRAELDVDDPFFPLVIGVRARKAAPALGWPSRAPGPRKSARGAVLLYHRVCEVADDVHQLAVSPAAFREQMTYLRDRCHPLPLQDLVTLARNGALPPRAVAVTFDDGYADNLTIARPILDNLEIPATFFLVTDRIDEERPFWWDVLADALLANSMKPASALTIELPDGERTFPAAHRDERLAAYWAIYHAIVGTPADVRDAVVDAVQRWRGGTDGIAPAGRRVNSSMARELTGVGLHSAGAHSVHHEMLPRQLPDVQRREVADSRAMLERALDRRVAAFAYPYGAYCAETIEAVRSAGFDIAVTCDQTTVNSDSDPLRIPRLMVSHERAAAFADWLDALFEPAR